MAHGKWKRLMIDARKTIDYKYDYITAGGPDFKHLVRLFSLS